MRASILMATTAVVGSVGVAVMAQPGGQVGHATVRLWSPMGPLVAGRTGILVLDFKIDEGWHLYWDGLNDSGFPPEIEWKLPPGFELAGPVQWPAPVRHVSPGPIVDHIYEKRVMLMAPIRVPKNAVGTAQIGADLKWLVCKDVCLPGDAHLVDTVQVVAASDPADTPPPREPAEYTAFRARVPVPVPKDAGVEARVGGDAADIRVPGATRITFYPLAACTPPADIINEGSINGRHLHLALVPKPGEEPRLAGVLEVVLGSEPAPRFWSIDTSLAGSGEQK
ncbi:MAG: hypothetical protein IT437_03540 [Phycisphaerales bacterium]|nr:hypothetical protein [Phycisphaerales bacterium]